MAEFKPELSDLQRGLLAFAAGLVDTTTFIHMGGFFAAHVTGNFVVFAAGLVDAEGGSQLFKLAAFPVFILGVWLGALVYGARASVRWVLGLEFGLLLVSGASALAAQVAFQTLDLGLIDRGLALALVVSMGLQNALHKFVPGPMSTVMTGNVTGLTTVLWNRVRGRGGGDGTAGWLILAFFLGCVAAAPLVQVIGMAAVTAAVPAVGIVLATLRRGPTARRPRDRSCSA